MAGSWATVAAIEAEQPICSDKGSLADVLPKSKCAVLDASAIIGAESLRNHPGTLYTTPEVYSEVHDKHSQQVLASLPAGIVEQEPTASSISAVTSFARAIGEIHSLSRADLQLIALAHSLHLQLHGEHSLHTEPASARVVSKVKQNNRLMPGWGAKGGKWEEMDRLEEAEKEALEQAQGQSEASRVAAQIQDLNLRGEPEQPSTPSQNQESAAPLTPLKPGNEGPPAVNGTEDEDQWEMAAVSQNAARRRKRKEARRTHYAASMYSEQSKAHPQDKDGQTSPAVEPREQAPAAQAGNDQASFSGGSTASEDLDSMNGGAHEDESSDGESNHEGFTSEAGGDEQALVSIVTADFAMQNLILQLGLKLVSPDGRQIKRISRWALRCSACFKVTKEAERVFCPTCGNAALQKVEIVIDENGAEQYGVRKRHNIRGTRFSLPKPKGGKNSHDPILREDVMMQRLPRRKPRAPTTDPFVPEYNGTTWHDAKGGLSTSGMHKGVAAALASWKHNPNERKMPRTNRRK